MSVASNEKTSAYDYSRSRTQKPPPPRDSGATRLLLARRWNRRAHVFRNLALSLTPVAKITRPRCGSGCSLLGNDETATYDHAGQKTSGHFEVAHPHQRAKYEFSVDFEERPANLREFKASSRAADLSVGLSAYGAFRHSVCSS
jgi:hypothetical protein